MGKLIINNEEKRRKKSKNKSTSCKKNCETHHRNEGHTWVRVSLKGGDVWPEPPNKTNYIEDPVLPTCEWRLILYQLESKHKMESHPVHVEKVTQCAMRMRRRLSSLEIAGTSDIHRRKWRG